MVNRIGHWGHEVKMEGELGVFTWPLLDWLLCTYVIFRGPWKRDGLMFSDKEGGMMALLGI